MNEVNALFKRKLNDDDNNVEHVGIVYAKDWWDATYKPAVQPFDYVVCRWSDFHDGVSSHIEGKQTIAICRELKHAELIYKLL